MSVPEKFLDLFTTSKRAFAHLATTMPSGAPQVTPVWFDYDGEHVIFNTAKGRVKERNLKEGSPVAMAISDPENPYRYIQIRGHVTEIIDDDPEMIRKLSLKYRGDSNYPLKEGEIRVTYKITPDKASTMG